MKRRDFITLLGGAAAAWPMTARAQQQGKLPIIGFLGTTSASAWAPWTAAFTQRLRELGWIEGHTVAIEYRWDGDHNGRATEFAAEFVRLKVDVIVTAGVATIAAKRTTSDIPIVFALSNNPVASGLVASLARPGGNVTGLSTQQTDTVGKRLELMHEVVPGIRRWAIMANVDFPEAVLELDDVQATARTLGLELAVLEIRRADDIAPSFEGLKSRADALYVCSDPLTMTNRLRINTFALAAGLPTMNNIREFVEGAGLMSYGPSYSDLFRRAGDYVDKILRGAKPTDLPVQQPTKFELVINLTTAKALGLTIPPTLLARADEVIE